MRFEGIPDLVIEAIQQQSDGQEMTSQLLSFDDHLLRRFGELQLIERNTNKLESLSVRGMADEIWFLLEGAVECTARDLRSGSPGAGNQVQFELSEPTRVMVPFGVAFGWRTMGQPALMLRCATHAQNTDSDDKEIPLEGEA